MPAKELLITVSTNDIKLHVLLSTPQTPSTRPALLLLHFWGGSNRTYQPAVNLLADNYNIIAPSLRGWGQSTKPDNAQAYRIADYAADIVSLLQELQSSQPHILVNGVALIGHSMGGKLAQVLLTYTELAPLVKGVILIAPAPSGSFALPEDMREQQIHAYDNRESALFVVENVLLGKADNVTEATRIGVASDAVSGSPGARAAWPKYGMGEDYENSVVNSIKGYKSSHGAFKVLIIVGELDRVEAPANVENRIAVVLRNAGADVQTRLLSSIGHLIPLEAPRSMVSALSSFVERL